MGRAARALLALIVAGLLVLSGCAGRSPNTAATVNGTAITMSEVEAFEPVLTPYLQQQATPAQTTLLVVSLMVQARIGNELADQQQLTFTDEERAAVTQNLPSDLVSDSRAADFVAGYGNLYLVNARLGDDAFLQAAAQQAVEINPRLGTWNPSNLSAVGGLGSLSQPAQG